MINQNSALESLRTNSSIEKAESKRTELGQEQFLNLMIEQLKNQDPFKPMENGEFIAQMAQFGTVNGVQELNQSFKDFTGSMQGDAVLRAASLVDRDVLVGSNYGYLGDTGYVEGRTEVQGYADNVRVTISSSSGEFIKDINLGATSGGEKAFVWDGTDARGNPVNQGTYKIQIEAQSQNDVRALPVAVVARVNSIAIDGGKNSTLVLRGIGEAKLSDVMQIR